MGEENSMLTRTSNGDLGTGGSRKFYNKYMNKIPKKVIFRLVGKNRLLQTYVTCKCYFFSFLVAFY